MKVLVTGGTGFIGQWVVQELLEQGDEVLVFDHHRRTPTYHSWWNKTEATQVEHFYGDIRDDVAVTEAFAHAERFIHLAAVLGTQETITNPRPAAMSNLQGGLNILEAAAQYEMPGCYIGVGNHWMNNTYSISKTMIERFIDMFNKERGTRINIVRVVNAYGPGQIPASPYGEAKVRKITPSFVCRALCDDEIEIYGDGEQVSDMVWVGDVAKTLVAATKTGICNEKAYEVGPLESNTVNEVANLIVELTGSKSHISHLPMRPGEIPGAVVAADTSQLYQLDIDAANFKSLRDGMSATADYFRDYLAETHRP